MLENQIINQNHRAQWLLFKGLTEFVISYQREAARRQVPQSWRSRSRCRAWTSRRSRPRRTTAGHAPEAIPILSSSASPTFCGSVQSSLLKSWKLQWLTVYTSTGVAILFCSRDNLQLINSTADHKNFFFDLFFLMLSKKYLNLQRFYSKLSSKIRLHA